MTLLYLATFLSLELLAYIFLKLRTTYPNTQVGLKYKFAKEDKISWEVTNTVGGVQLIYSGVIIGLVGVFSLIYPIHPSWLFVFYVLYMSYCVIGLYLVCKRKVREVKKSMQ